MNIFDDKVMARLDNYVRDQASDQIAIAGIADHHRQGEIMRQWKAQHGIAA